MQSKFNEINAKGNSVNASKKQIAASEEHQYESKSIPNTETEENPEMQKLAQGRIVNLKGNLREKKEDSSSTIHVVHQLEDKKAADFIKEAREFMMNKKKGDPLKELQQAELLEPSNPEIFLLKGIYYQRLWQFKEAIEEYNKSMALGNNKSLEVANQRQYCRKMYKKYLRSQEILKQVRQLSKSPTLLKDYSSKAQELLKSLQDGTTKTTEEKLELSLFIRALSFDFEGKHEKAQKDWSQLMEINPCSAEYRYFMANSRFFSGKTTEALGEYLISLDMIAYKGDKLSDCINSNHNFIVYKKKV